MADWKIVLEPHSDPEWMGGGVLEILDTDEEGAVEALEGWAETIERLGFVPDSGLDWRNRSPANVGARAGRKSFRMRVDSFERETEYGQTSGAGWLRAKEVV